MVIRFITNISEDFSVNNEDIELFENVILKKNKVLSN